MQSIPTLVTTSARFLCTRLSGSNPIRTLLYLCLLPTVSLAFLFFGLFGSSIICNCWSSVSKVCAFAIIIAIMFFPPRPPSPRQRSTSCSTDDQSSTKDRPRKLFQRHYAHDLTFSSHSLATTNSLHDDLPTPSMPAHASHTPSVHSTPMTSPSTGYSSLLPGSLSSATSESAPSADSNYRSEFGLLTSGSSAYSPLLGSASSRSSHPVSPWSRSTTESDLQSSAFHTPQKRPSGHFLNRSLTAPNSPPIFATPMSADSGPTDHVRSHSRFTESIKSLFSRHAVQSPPRFSLSSATTTPLDSEASSGSFHVPAASGKWSMTPRKSHLPDLEISGTVAPATPSPGRDSNTPIDAHRRYASEVAAKLSNSRAGSSLATSQDSVDVSFRNVTPVRGRDPKTRNVLRRRPSGSAKFFKGRERGLSSPSPHPTESHSSVPSKEGISRQASTPLPLTPAGAVVEAYKQQELHRDMPSPPKLSIDDRMSSAASHDDIHDGDHLERSPAPYYTVFGTSTERRVRAGGPDDWSGRFEADQRTFHPSQGTSLHQPSMSDPGGRSLTRKLSSRWRKVKGAGEVPGESSLRDRGHTKGRPSLHEIWRNDASTLRSTGRSMDGVPNPADGAWASPTASHVRSESKGDRNEGPKLWQLMRRISTGGMRDRFQSDKVVPPVPAIPKDLLKKPNERGHDTLSKSHHHPPSSSHDKDLSQTRTEPRNITRPSVATSSSSPNSSDVASMQFFHKTHSSRSSVSSYGEAVVISRSPETMLDRRIITPLEQLRLADGHAEGSKPSSTSLPRFPRRSTSVPAVLKLDADGDHFPLPSPRRQTCSGETPSSSSSRPCSVSPSVPGSARGSYQYSGAVPGQPRLVDGIVSLSPPPRPSRNLPRVGGGSVGGSPSHSMLVKQVDGGVGIGAVGARQMDRTPSSQSDMTARAGSPETGQSQREDQPASRSTQLMFRELDAPRKPPLSEQEKTDIWNDLLARSDKAGGTLHINGAAELMSDSMRLSTYSYSET